MGDQERSLAALDGPISSVKLDLLHATCNELTSRMDRYIGVTIETSYEFSGIPV